MPVEEVADSFVAYCTAPAPAVEDWLLLTGDLPEGTRIPLGRYTLQTFTAEELRQLGPMPALYGLQPGGLDLGLLAGAPFVHAPIRTVRRTAAAYPGSISPARGRKPGTGGRCCR